MPDFNQLWNAVGGLSKTTKMPGYSWSIPPKHCITGSQLRAKAVNGPCTHCYARRGNYQFPTVQKAMQRRLDIYNADPSLWVFNMTALLHRPKIAESGYFRWFDAGDLQSEHMLTAILWVCTNTPKLKHYLPTKERKFVWPRKSYIPANLALRHALPIFNMLRSRLFGKQLLRNILTCAVVTNGSETCPAHKQGNQCGDCRACWDRRRLHISYRRH